MTRSPRRWACRCSSAGRPRPGSAPPTRTRTGCCASTSPRAATCGCTAPGGLAAVAAELNDRPRKTLGWNTPAAAGAALAQHPPSRTRQLARRWEDWAHGRHAPPHPRAATQAAEDRDQAWPGAGNAARAGAAAGRGRHRRRQHRRPRPANPAGGDEPRGRAAQHDPLHSRRTRPRPSRRHPAPGDRGRCRRRHSAGRGDPGPGRARITRRHRPNRRRLHRRRARPAR